MTALMRAVPDPVEELVMVPVLLILPVEKVIPPFVELALSIVRFPVPNTPPETVNWPESDFIVPPAPASVIDRFVPRSYVPDVDSKVPLFIWIVLVEEASPKLSEALICNTPPSMLVVPV